MGKRKRYSDHQADPPDEDTQKETPTRKAGRVKFKHVAKLLSLAAEGKHKKIRGYVERKALDVNAYNSEGLTALHQASRFGHADAVHVLLRLGADSKAEDFQGNTAARFAADKSHAGVLAHLLQAQDESGSKSSEMATSELRDMLQAAIDQRAFSASIDRTETQSPGSKLKAMLGEDLASEDEWDAKLRMNAAMDDPFQEQEFLSSSESYWESWDYNSFAQPDVGPEDEEAYARRMWEDMQKKSHTQSQATPATAEAWGQADSAQGRRRKAAEEASERSRKILEEEQAKDRAWRQAVLQGDQGAKKAAYEAKWQTLITMSGPVLYSDIPWLASSEEGAKALILHGVQGPADRKKRLRLELMRWHPDKFTAKFGARIAGPDRGRVAEGVKRVSQLLNSLSSRGD